MAQKPSIPKGTRDFNPEQVAKRNYIFSTIKSSFERFGFQPIETPSFENSDTLMGKYGEEGDRLIFKILNSGDFLESAKKDFSKRYDIEIYELLINIHEKMISIIKDQNFVSDRLTAKFEFIIREFYYTIRDLDDFQFNVVVKSILKRKSQIIDRCKRVIGNQNYVVNDSNLKHFLGQERRNYIREVSLNIAKELFEGLLETNKSKLISKEVSEKALRYDLTVPFARYVVQHQNEIEFPFKRYQIQPVWRADRPQKGRFREFFQCDADVVGSKSLWQEVEFVQLYDDVFASLGLEGVTIKINNRKILSGIAEVIGAQDKLIDFTVALDKLDKIGEEKVKEEMLNKGIPQEGIDKLQPLFSISGTFEAQIKSLKTILSASVEGLKGIEELEFIDTAISSLGLKTATLELNVTLARGLNYYTGAIFEVSAPKGVNMGSIGGGGRYDDLTGIFGLKNVSGVGISFGLDRIYLVLEELDLFPETVSNTVDVLFINFGEQEALYCLKAIKILRDQGINAELYPDAVKMKKQMNFANKRQISNVVLVGDEELENNNYSLKNMTSGEQKKVAIEDLINSLK